MNSLISCSVLKFQEMKVVMLEDLAAHFKLKTQVNFADGFSQVAYSCTYLFEEKEHMH